MANTAVLKEEQAGNGAAPERTRGGLTFTPRVDIVETELELLLYADLPGVPAEDVDIRFEKGELVLHGRCAPRHEGVNLRFSEYGVGDFYRAFSISEAVDPTKIAASLKDGVLTLRLPKTEKAKPKRISVKAE